MTDKLTAMFPLSRDSTVAPIQVCIVGNNVSFIPEEMKPSDRHLRCNRR